MKGSLVLARAMICVSKIKSTRPDFPILAIEASRLNIEYCWVDRLRFTAPQNVYELVPARKRGERFGLVFADALSLLVYCTVVFCFASTAPCCPASFVCFCLRDNTHTCSAPPGTSSQCKILLRSRSGVRAPPEGHFSCAPNRLLKAPSVCMHNSTRRRGKKVLNLSRP